MKLSVFPLSALLTLFLCLSAAAQVQNTGADTSLISSGPQFVISSTVDPRGNVWIGSQDQGVWRTGPDGNAQFTAGQGLADDTVCSLACDSLGRVWAGENMHGVAVFDGQTWHNYDITQGPGGSHVTAIATCPTDGDVWLATENGLTRYSIKGDNWSYFDRSTGMPDVQVSGIAFDSSGNIFVALQCGGVTMATPADNYQTWHTVTGPDEMPAARVGDGLPSPLVNAIAVDKDNNIYAGTCNGLAYSTDHGQNWKFLRGKDWLNLVKGSYDGAPPDLIVGRPTLQEDWITSLSTAHPGVLYIGYRSHGYQVIRLPGHQLSIAAPGAIRTLCPLPDGSLIVGTYGRGALKSGMSYNGMTPPPAASAAPSALPVPTPAAPPSEQDLTAMTQQVTAFTSSTLPVTVLPDDWSTRGDWPGRYGHEYAFFCGVSGAPAIKKAPFDISFADGPYRTRAAVYYQYQGRANRGNPLSSLFVPDRMRRIYGEVNDSGANTGDTPMSVEGPDLYVKISVPDGVHRISLFFSNDEAHTGRNAFNDYFIQVKCPDASASPTTLPTPESLIDDSGVDDNRFGQQAQTSRGSASIDAELSPTLARLRVPDNWDGVYKRMLLRGPAVYWIKIDRNHSNTTKFQGLFADAGGGDGPAVVDLGIPRLPQIKTPVPASDPTTLPSPIGAAAQLWATLDSASDKQGYADCAARFRIAAYRAASAAGADSTLLANWRWRLPIWTDADHQQMEQFFKIATAIGGQ